METGEILLGPSRDLVIDALRRRLEPHGGREILSSAEQVLHGMEAAADPMDEWRKRHAVPQLAHRLLSSLQAAHSQNGAPKNGNGSVGSVCSSFLALPASKRLTR